MVEERGMIQQLLKFDRIKVKRNEAVISWKTLAFEVGVSKTTLQRWFEARGIELPRWGSTPRSPVFLPRGRIAILKVLYFG